MIAAATTAVVVLGATGVAGGATGDLDYKDCITGETESGATGSGACGAIASAASSAANSGLGGAGAIAASPDGASLYVVSLEDDAISRFNRNTTSGKLTYKGCITGETQSGPAGSGACEVIPTAKSSGTNSGMDFPVALDVSPDGTSVYVAAKSDDAVARFKRDPTSGKLSYKGCITGESESASVCDAIPGTASGGENAGLNEPQAIDLSADGAWLYLAGLGDEAVIRFKRDTTSGKLTYKDCITGDTAAGPTGSAACDAIPSATAAGSASGLANPIDVALSADGASLYLAAQGDTAIARFNRDTTSGKLTYKDCITGETETGPAGSGACDAIPSAASLGDGSGLDSPHSITLSPDGTSFYATASSDDAVARFERNTTSGKLSYKGCLTGDESLAGVCRKIPPATLGGASSGLDTAGSAAMSSDGASLYVGSPFDDAVTAFARDTTSGKLTHQACVTGEVATGPAGSGACADIPSAAANGTNSGLDNPQALGLSPDGSSLYAGTNGDDSIARFSRAP